MIYECNKCKNECRLSVADIKSLNDTPCVCPCRPMFDQSHWVKKEDTP